MKGGGGGGEQLTSNEMALFTDIVSGAPLMLPPWPNL